jgi:hypothetical protein
MNMRSTRHTEDGVWRSRVRAFIASQLGRHTGEVLLDLSKAYENVAWHHLQAAAVAHEFPLPLVRLAIQSYGWPRNVVLTGDYAVEAIQPSQGIIAGSSFATFEIDLLIMGVLAETFKRWETSAFRVHLTVQVDDISVEVEDSAAVVGEVLPDITNDLTEALSTRLGLPIAGQKTVVIASRQDIAKRVAAAIGRRQAAAATTRRLGVDHTYGRKDLQTVRTGRFVKAAQRKHKLRRLQHRASQYRVAAAGILSSLKYGTVVVGPTPLQVRALRSWAVQFASSGGAGIPMELSLLGLPAGGDPLAQCYETALRRYAREVHYLVQPHHHHRDALSAKELRQFWEGWLPRTLTN